MATGSFRRLFAGFMLLSVTALVACGRPAATPAAPAGSTGGSSGGSAPAVAYEMKIGLATVKDTQDMVANFFAKEVEKLSGGKIKGVVYNASQLGNNDKMNKDVRSGAQEVLIQPSSFASSYIPAMGVLDLPFLWPSDEVQTKVLNSGAIKPLQDSAETAGVEIVGTFADGVKVTATTFPVAKAGDLKGHKFRVFQSPELVGQYKAWGAIGVPMALNEVYTALQQGTVEGLDNVVDVLVAMKYHEVAKNITTTDHGALTSLIMVNDKWLSSLPADLQKAVRDAGKTSAQEALKIAAQNKKNAVEAITKGGGKITEFPAAERDKLKVAAQPLYEEIRKDKAKAELLDAFQKAIAEAK